jgi:hypothetical protein
MRIPRGVRTKFVATLRADNIRSREITSFRVIEGAQIEGVTKSAEDRKIAVAHELLVIIRIIRNCRDVINRMPKGRWFVLANMGFIVIHLAHKAAKGITRHTRSAIAMTTELDSLELGALLTEQGTRNSHVRTGLARRGGADNDGRHGNVNAA